MLNLLSSLVCWCNSCIEHKINLKKYLIKQRFGHFSSSSSPPPKLTQACFLALFSLARREPKKKKQQSTGGVLAGAPFMTCTQLTQLETTWEKGSAFEHYYKTENVYFRLILFSTWLHHSQVSCFVNHHGDETLWSES